MTTPLPRQSLRFAVYSREGLRTSVGGKPFVPVRRLVDVLDGRRRKPRWPSLPVELTAELTELVSEKELSEFVLR